MANFTLTAGADTCTGDPADDTTATLSSADSLTGRASPSYP